MKETYQCARGVRACTWGSFSHVSLECHRSTMDNKLGPHFHSLGSCPMTGVFEGTPRGCGS